MKKVMLKNLGIVWLLVFLVTMFIPQKVNAESRRNQSIVASDITVSVGDNSKKICAKSKTSLSYKSSDPSIVGVNSQGKLTPKKGGTVKITIYAKATSKYNSTKKTITVKVRMRRINPQKAILKLGKVYRNYDITGDRKKDSILISKSGKDTLNLYINNKKQILTKGFSEYCGVNLQLYTLENGKAFLYVGAKCMELGNDGVCGVFQYQSGKMKQIINMGAFFGEYGTLQQGEVLDIKKDGMKIRVHMMAFSTGSSWIDFEYIYKDGTLKCKNDIGSYYSMGIPKRRGIVNKKLSVYRSAGSNSEIYTLKKGDIVTILRCKYLGKKMYIEVSHNGKKGWIKAQDKWQREKQFSNVYYAS